MVVPRALGYRMRWADENLFDLWFQWLPKHPGFKKLTIIAVAAFVAANLLNFAYFFYGGEGIAPLSQQYLQWGPFQSMYLPGFVSSEVIAQQSCDILKYNASVEVQKSRHLVDDLEQIALSLEQHPVVVYRKSTLENPDFTFSDRVNRAWSRMSGSAVWLPDQHVFLVVTRIIFLGEREVLTIPKVSFLRGQLFDENWTQLENYNIQWTGEIFTFPLVFDIPTEYEGGPGEVYGPEDPRIIIENNVEGAEPVIIFNMIHGRSNWKRAMYIFRPFSKHTTILTIRDKQRPRIEKNWAPFFLAPDGLQDTHQLQKPNEYLHFVYSFRPLHILKCHLGSGDCVSVFQAQLAPASAPKDEEDIYSFTGGTNFVPALIPKGAGIHSDIRVHVAFTRTNIHRDCGTGDYHFYRPELIVMLSFRERFLLAFASAALDFGSTFFEMMPNDDPCQAGRILIPNSISRWDTTQDVMSITCSVDDRTVQVARMHGLLSFVKGLLGKSGPLQHENLDLTHRFSSWAGDDARGCSVESAVNYTMTMSRLHDLRFPAPGQSSEADHAKFPP